MIGGVAVLIPYLLGVHIFRKCSVSLISFFYYFHKLTYARFACQLLPWSYAHLF
nr:MAG TPA: hypothetical protein [Caudoviricetes sp.]